MVIEQFRPISFKEIESSIARHCSADTNYPAEFETLENAIAFEASFQHERVNDFKVLTESMICESEDGADGSLAGAKVGDLVWGGDEAWHSSSSLAMIHDEKQKQFTEEMNDIDLISSMVWEYLILSRLTDYNSTNRYVE